MLKKIQNTWTSLNRTISVNQRELVLGLAACALVGMAIGTLLSPNVNVTIGSNNTLSPEPLDTPADDEDSEE